MENIRDRTSEDNNESRYQLRVLPQETTLITSLPLPKHISFKASDMIFPMRKNIHKPSHLLQASILEIKRSQLLKQLCLIAIFNCASKRLSTNRQASERTSHAQYIKKSFSVSTLLKQLSPLNSLHNSPKIIIGQSKHRLKNDVGFEKRWVINIAHILYKNRKRYVTQRKIKAMQSFEIVLNSKVQDLKMDMKSFNIDDVQYSLDPISLLNTNTGPKQREDRKAQMFDIVNRDIMNMTSRNPGHEYTVIQQIVDIIKNKVLSVKNQIIQLQKSVGQLSYRDFKQFYEQIKKINLHMTDVLSILNKYLFIQQNKLINDFNQPSIRKGFIMKKDNQSYHEIVTLSLKNIIENFCRLHNNLNNISSKYFTKSKTKKINNQNFKKFLYSASKLRYHLIYLNKQIVFLKSKLPVEVQEQSPQKNSPGYRSMRKVLYDKYFFNRNQTDENQKESKNAKKILFSNQKHKIADNRMEIKRRLYNAPCSNRTIKFIKQYRSMYPSQNLD